MKKNVILKSLVLAAGLLVAACGGGNGEGQDETIAILEALNREQVGDNGALEALNREQTDEISDTGGSSGGGSLTPTFASLIGASVIAHDGTFLGIVSRNQFASTSICNDFGSYGSQFSSTSIFNDFGTYGSQFSSKSAFNLFTSTPPRLISLSGAVLGRLTTKQFAFGAVNPIALVRFLRCTDVLN